MMKKTGCILIMAAWLILAPSLATADVDVQVNIGIPLPPPIVFPAPPEVIVIPETYVYAVPDVDVDIFFYNGWWWRPWEGRWYRSRYYDRDWVYYNRAPAFYKRVPPGWRKDFRDRRWKGYDWDQRRIRHGDMEKNWRGWQQQKHWERTNYWGVKGKQPRTQAPVRSRQQQFRDDRPGPPAKQAGPPPGQVRPSQDRRDRDMDDDRGRGRGKGKGPQKDRSRDRDDDRNRDRDGRR